MSSQEESEPMFALASRDVPPAEKRRRVRACDACRRRKVRCDGGRLAGQQCSNCTSFNYICTYTQSARKRFADPEYVQSLESQLAQTHELLSKLAARLGHLEPNPSTHEPRGPSPTLGGMSVTPGTPPATHNRNTDVDDDSSDGEYSQEHLENVLRNMCLGPGHPQFMGKSSNLTLCVQALDAKQEYVAKATPAAQTPPTPATRVDRPYPWEDNIWLSRTQEQPYAADSFPEPALMWSLIDLYFRYTNVYMPLLHRQTFDKHIRDGLHLRDEGFGSTLLLVCGIGAKFSDDPRILTEPGNKQTAGWELFQKVQTTRKAIKLTPPTLYDVQVPCLIGLLLFGAPCPQAAFAVIGSGIRIAQDLGAHRRKCYKPFPTPEGELLKRAFWTLIAMDRNLSSALGRPCCIQDEDYDLELPIECDDEYWYTADPSLAFKQPLGKPSKLSFFNCFIRLNQVHARALRTIYAINKSKAPQQEQNMVAELDSALNQWIDTIPNHLRWDPHKEDDVFLNQSALLYAWYHSLQVVVHRQYIPAPGRPSALSFPSLAICTNAARSTIHILDAQHRRCPVESFLNIISLFTAGVVLTVNIWGGKRSGASSTTRDIEDVRKCMGILRTLEPRWYVAGRILDVLTELATMGDHTDADASELPSLKRGRDAESSPSSSSSSSSIATPVCGVVRPIAGSSRVQQNTSPTHGNPTVLTTNGGFSLPVHGDEQDRPLLHQPINVEHLPEYRSDPIWVSPSGPYAQPSGGSLANLMPSYQSSPSRGLAQSEQPYDDRYKPFFGPSPPAEPLHAFAVAARPAMDGFDGAWFADIDLQSDSVTAYPEIANDTLTLLSTAPNSMDWGDWGAYITSLNGYGAVHDEAQNLSNL